MNSKGILGQSILIIADTVDSALIIYEYLIKTHKKVKLYKSAY